MCTNRAFEPAKGIVCRLTMDSANFILTCPDFVEDPYQKQVEQEREEQLVRDGIGVKGTCRRLSIVLWVTAGFTVLNSLTVGLGFNFFFTKIGFALAAVLQVLANVTAYAGAVWGVFALNLIFALFMAWVALKIKELKAWAVIVTLIIVSLDTGFALLEFSIISFIWHIILILLSAITLRELNKAKKAGTGLHANTMDILDA